nr:hypothetical protein Iba_chr08aCG12960 [Ipomoea batatas]
METYEISTKQSRDVPQTGMWRENVQGFHGEEGRREHSQLLSKETGKLKNVVLERKFFPKRWIRCCNDAETANRRKRNLLDCCGPSMHRMPLSTRRKYKKWIKSSTLKTFDASSPSSDGMQEVGGGHDGSSETKTHGGGGFFFFQQTARESHLSPSLVEMRQSFDGNLGSNGVGLGDGRTLPLHGIALSLSNSKKKKRKMVGELIRGGDVAYGHDHVMAGSGKYAIFSSQLSTNEHKDKKKHMTTSACRRSVATIW